MDFSDLITTNQKLNFSLSSAVEARKYSCLVKKIKGALMAVVISNRDKAKLDLSVDDDIYLFCDHNDETWISHTRIAQIQSYPLVILDMSGEPVPISGRKQDSLPALVEGIESVENDHLAPEPVVELETGLSSIESMSVEPVVETPENELTPESIREEAEEISAEETVEADTGQSENVAVDPVDMPVDMDDVLVFNDGLEDIPDVDTSELEAELEADIDNLLEEQVEELDLEANDPTPDNLDELEEEYTDDSMENMELVELENLDVGEVDYQEADMDADDLGQPVESDLEPPLDLKEQVGAEAEPFEDFFSFEFVVVDSETAEKLEGVINKYSSKQRLSFDAAEEIEDLDLVESGDGDDNGLKEALKGLLTRVTRVENTIGRFSGNAYNNQLSFGNAISEGSSDPIRSSICLSVDRTGVHAALDGPLPDGACVLLMINRQWNPPLRFDAVAVLLESETNESGVSTGKFRFSAIHPDDTNSIDEYLKRGSEYLQSLKDLTKS